LAIPERKAGFWLEEFAAPYVKDAGTAVAIASLKGGQPPPLDQKREYRFQTELTSAAPLPLQAELPNTEKS